MYKKGEGGAGSVYSWLTGLWYQTLVLWASQDNPGLENYLFLSSLKSLVSYPPTKR